MEAMKQTIADLQKRNSDISNKNVHLEAMVTELEQKIQDIETQKLTKCVEVSNVPVFEKEDVHNIAENVARRLKQPIESITNVTRLDGKTDELGLIRVELKTENTKHNWLKAANKKNITVGHAIPNAPKHMSKKPVFVKEALTTLKKNILWQTRQELKDKLNDAFISRGFTSPKQDQTEQQNNESDDDQSDNDPSEKAPLMGSSVNLATAAKKPEIIANVPKVSFEEKTRKEEPKDRESNKEKDKIVGAQPTKRRSSQDSPVVLSVLEDVKRIKVNNNKKEPLTNLTITQQPSIYPHLSDIETDTSHTQEEYSDCGGSRCGHYTLECIFFFLCI